MWLWNGKPFKYKKSRFNQKVADALIGKTVLIGKTYQKPDGTVVKRTQQHGTIKEVHITDGIAIQLHNSDEVVWLPPDIRGWQPTLPGIYTSKTTGEEVENPDYITTWIVDA